MVTPEKFWWANETSTETLVQVTHCISVYSVMPRPCVSLPIDFVLRIRHCSIMSILIPPQNVFDRLTVKKPLDVNWWNFPGRSWDLRHTSAVYKDGMISVGRDVIEKSMKDTAKYQDNFEVYIQTLISQALDSNFLTEIFQEQDDYFLSNVKTVDDITEERKCRLLKVAQWKSGLQESVGTWPCFNVIADLPFDEKNDKLCAACSQSKVSARVQMYGQPYNGTTLEGCQPDPKVANQKDFLLCTVCVTRVELYNKVSHQKYLMYIECAKRVAEKRASDSDKDTTVILNELLADEAWLNQLFRSVRTSWAEIDKMEHQAQNNAS